MANLTIILSVIAIDEEMQLFNVYDFNNSPLQIFEVDPNGKRLETTPYILLKKDDILQFSNLDYANMVKALKKIALTESFSSRVLELLLNLLLAYDESEKKDALLLDAIIEIADWLDQNDLYLSKNIRKLNLLQAIKRKRLLEDEEKQYLRMLVESKPGDEAIYVGAYLLLDDLETAKKHYERMEKNKQESFRNFPIYNFFK